MFTGLVETMGRVAELRPNAGGVRLVLEAPLIAAGVAVGDSISVSGCCLTVVQLRGNQLDFDVVPETLRCTTLGELTVGSAVNVERSLKVGDRLGGHFVTGHIDGTGRLEKREQTGEWLSYWFSAPRPLLRHMASKGSVAVDGVSLTLVEVTASRFSVALIPHTLQATTLGQLQVGDRVNLETDVLAKYVERMLLAKAQDSNL